MQQTEGCSESRMRSRTSREVPNWSGGEELYIGSVVSAIGKDPGVTGIVPGPPDGSRGSTGWGHPSRRAPWAEVGREPAHSGLVRPPWAFPLRLGLELGNRRAGGAPLALGGKHSPLGRRPPGDPSPGLRPTLGGLYKGGGRKGSRTPAALAPPSPRYTSPSLHRSLAKPCWNSAASTTTPSCCWIFINLSFPLAGSRRRRRRSSRTCVERGGAVLSALVIGDSDHGEYDSIIHVLLERFRCDLQVVCRCSPIPSLLEYSMDRSW